MKVDLINKCNILATEYDSLLGEYVEKLSEPVDCRIINKVNKIIDLRGEESISSIKVILPKNIDIAAEYKIMIDNKNYEIRNISYKQNLKGSLEYILVYV